MYTLFRGDGVGHQGLRVSQNKGYVDKQALVFNFFALTFTSKRAFPFTFYAFFFLLFKAALFVFGHSSGKFALLDHLI